MKTFSISYTRWKRSIFITGHEGKEERMCCKAFQHTESSPLTKHALVSSDEKNFFQYQWVNSQKNCWLDLSPQDVTMLIKSKHPDHFMVFRVGSQVMVTLCLHSSYYKAKMDASIKGLEELMLSWIKSMAAGRLYNWQQDSALYHTSRKTQS